MARAKTHAAHPSPTTVLALVCLAFCGCRKNEPASPSAAPPVVLAGPFVHDAQIMGSRFRVTLFAPDEATAKAAAQDAFAAAQRVNDLLSDYQNDSEALRLSGLPHGLPHPVSEDFADVLKTSLALASETDGAFDPSIGPATRLWRRARLGKAMDWKALEECKPALGWRKITFDGKSRTVTLNSPGMRLDFGGIGKGWSADKALQVLRSKGLNCASVSASGDLAIGDPPPGKPGWTVGIELLDAAGGAVSAEVQLRNCGLSTSGDTEQFLELDGQRYSHILDPASGMALTERRGVSVTAPSATESDAIATALCVMGPEKGRVWAESRGVGAFFVTLTADGGKKRSTTANWPAFGMRRTMPEDNSRLAEPGGNK